MMATELQSTPLGPRWLRRWLMAVSVLAFILYALAATPAARAAAPPSPRQALDQAAKRIHALAAKKPSRKTTEVVQDLTRATRPSLWINSGEVVAPSYGTRVFDDCTAALSALQRLRSSARARNAAIALIVAADRGIATGQIAAASADSGLVTSATAIVTTGDHDAATGSPVLAVGSYRQAWIEAYGTLTQLVSAEATSVPSSDVAAAAQEALGSTKIALAGPVIERNPQPLDVGGKPELLFVGSEACPFCAVQRWGMVVALSQFGTFSNLHLMQSQTTESPEVESFTFAGSRYQSPYLSFMPIEAFSNVPSRFAFARLQPLNPAENALVHKFDQEQQVPFVDVANRFVQVQSTVEPALIGGMSWTQVAGSLTNPESVAAQAIGGEAEVLTAELCEATNGNPQSVCSAPVVQQYQAALPSLNGKGGGCPAAESRKADRRRGQPPLASPARCRTG